MKLKKRREEREDFMKYGSKVLAILLAMMMVLSITACGGTEKNKQAETTPEATEETTEETTDDEAGQDTADTGGTEKIKVGFVVKSLADQHWVIVKAGAEKAAADNDVELTFIAPNSESDVAKQVENIETLTAAGVDVICVAPSNDETVLPALENAVAAGIKIIAVDTDSSLSEKVCFIGTGNENAAREGALWAGEQIGEGGTAIILRGRLGDVTHDHREAGLKAGLEEKGITILETQAGEPTEEKGMNITENLLQKYPDASLVITTCDAMAVGAYNAVEASGASAQVYGFDGTIPVSQKVAEGEILGTTAQSPFEMGILGVETAIKIVKGEQVDSVIDSGQKVVNQENAQDYINDQEAKVAGAAE